MAWNDNSGKLNKSLICLSKCPLPSAEEAEDIHCLPVSVDFAGQAPVSQYFHPTSVKQFSHQISKSDANETKPEDQETTVDTGLQAHFRGRTLIGQQIELNKFNLKGIMLEEDQPISEEGIEASENAKKLWSVESHFNTITEWNLKQHNLSDCHLSDVISQWNTVSAAIHADV